MLKIGKISSPLYHFKLKDIIERTANPIEVAPDQKYTQIGIRSHGKGIFIKEAVIGAELGNKRVFWIESDCFIVNIVFAWERAVARTTSDLEGLIASHRFPMYKVNSLKVDLDYFTRLFLTKKGQMLLELASPGGAGRNKTLGQKEFLNLEINLPTLEIQKYVSSFLKFIDKKIQLQQEKIDFLKEQKKGFMQKIFSQELRFKDEDGQAFSKWELLKLKQIAEVYDGTHQTPNYKSFGVKFLSVQNIKNLKTQKYISAEDFNRDFKIAPKQGDILMTRIGDIGTSNIIKTNEPLAYYVSLALIKCTEKVDSQYLNQYISSELFQRELHKRTLHVAFPKKINMGEIGDCLVNLPNLKEQIKIKKVLEPMEININLNVQKLEQLKKQKEAFIQEMFI